MQVRIAELTQIVQSGFGEVTRRLDTQGAQLRSIDEQVQKTNGRVTALETVNTVRSASAGKTVGVVTLSDLKFYVAVAIGSGTMAVAVTLWVLKVADKL